MSSISRTATRAAIAVTALAAALGLATGVAATADLAPASSATSTAAMLPAVAPADLPYGPDTCINGYVWRAARPGDSVCVLPWVRTDVARQNSEASRHTLPAIFGQNVCLPGYTRRTAYPGDRVCVTALQEAQVTDDNAHTQQRYLRNQTTTPGTPTAPGGSTTLTADESELLRLINDARLHPQNYPPTGNTTGATMTACTAPFTASPALTGTARAHNQYLATQPLDLVNTYPNMHKDPDGKLATDAGEPMDQAGYHTYRAEIVADGFTTPADALRFWMQNDASSQWGHRNLILNCTIHDAGPAALAAGPGGHYWTVDMGNR